MSDDGQLLALHKACEVEEQKALQRKREVDRVRDERKKLFDVVAEKQEALRARIHGLLTTDRREAMCSRDVGRLQSISEYIERLRREIEALDPELSERRRELSQADERAALAEREFTAARLESRRLQKLIEERNLLALVQDRALEEADLDEMSTVRRNKS